MVQFLVALGRHQGRGSPTLGGCAPWEALGAICMEASRSREWLWKPKGSAVLLGAPYSPGAAQWTLQVQ